MSAAQAVLRTQEIDFAIVDFNLDREASVSIEIELEQRSIPYVLLTAYRADAAQRQSGDLSKPANPDLLVETIRGLVRADPRNA